MNKLLLTLLLALPTVAGCAAQEESTPVESESSELTSWSKVLTCDNGAAVLDVDTGERRNLQLVIRDPRIIGYLASQVRVSTRGILAPSGEIIVRGRQGWGVFAPNDFQSIDGGVDNASVNVRREAGGVKVVFYQSIGWSRCAMNEEPSPSTGMCSGGSVSGTTYNELATWFFRDCR